MLDVSTGEHCEDEGRTLLITHQGTPQYIQLIFPELVAPKQLSITFQGGFVGTKCAVQVLSKVDAQEWQLYTHVFPEDVNRKQTFQLAASETVPIGTTGIRLVFEESSAFFGRVTIYDLQLYGVVL